VRPILSDSDEHLIDQFRATGQIALLEEVLQRHLRPIRGMVFQMVLDHDAADDVTQDIFCELCGELIDLKDDLRFRRGCFGSR